MDIEEVAAHTPEKIHKVFVDPSRGLTDAEAQAAELRETGGEASVWGAEALTPSREKVRRDFFLAQVNGEYHKIIQDAAQARTEKQLRDLWAHYNRLKTQDYLKSPLAMEAKAACERQARVLRQEEDAE